MVVNCEQVWGEISNYIEGEVEAGLRAAMDEHFQSCQRCKSVLEGMRNVVRLYGDERMLELPAGFSRRMERKLAQPAGAGRGWSSWSAWLVPVAALVLIAGGLEVASSGVVNRPLESELQSQHAQPGRDIPPDMIVVVSAGAKLFHVAGCEFIHNKDKERTLTAKEAMWEGYVPCTRCLRKYLNTAESGFPRSVWQAGADFDEEGTEERSQGD